MRNELRLGLGCTILAISAVAGAAAAKHRFSMTGSYVEGCSCSPPCACELTGVEMGCQGVGAFSFTGGSYDGMSIAGVRTAYATKPGEWVTLYIDAPTPAKRKAAEAFMRTAFASWGKIGSVKNAKVAISHSGNKDTCSVDNGKIMSFESQAILGGDHKTPLCYSNVNDPMHPVVMQAKTLHCTYRDGDHSFKLKDTNAYFNHAIKSSGKV
jgi:hypothetical protein